jgi:hemerythrin-like domain-containing protein
MRITDALLGEHAILYRLLEHIASRSPSWSVAQAHDAGRFLAEALASHAQLEDDLLFVALEPYIAAQQGPLAVMRMEHSAIEGALERLPETTDVEDAHSLLLYLVEVAREHFAKEEQVLFRMAEQALGDQRLRELGATWAERRAVTVG